MSGPAPSRPSVLGIDIGGTKTALGIFDDGGRLIAEARLLTPRGDPLTALPLVVAEARRLTSGVAPAAVGIDLPAVVHDGIVDWAAWSFPGWDGFPLGAYWCDALGLPAVVDFDGYAAALGEFWQGAARGCADAVVVIVGTGVGAGVIHGGQLYRGQTGVAGAVGWTRFPDAEGRLGPPMEDVASGTAILRRARHAQPDGDERYATTRAVFDAAAKGDRTAERVIREAVAALASVVGSIASMLAPEIVVLGGGVGSRPDVVRSVRRLVLETAQPHTTRSLTIRRSALGARSSLYGAGYLAHATLAQEKEY